MDSWLVLLKSLVIGTALMVVFGPLLYFLERRVIAWKRLKARKQKSVL